MNVVDDARLLEVEGLSAWYERDRPVLTDVSFALEAGEAVGHVRRSKTDQEAQGMPQ